jgi:hypothetical protein
MPFGYEANPYDVVIAPGKSIRIFLTEGCDLLIDGVSYLQKIKDAADGTGGGAVTSVAGRTGVVVLTHSDISGLGSAALVDTTTFDATGAAAAAQAAAIAASIPISYLDTDATLAANSDTRVATQKALKTYIDAVAAGLTPKLPVRLATTGALPAGTYNNGSSGVGATFTVTATGTLTIDSVLTTLNNRILVQNQASGLQDGVYKVTTAGATGVQAVLTRDTDSDSGAALLSAVYGVTAGTVNAGLFFYVNNATAPTIGTDSIGFSQFTSVSQGGTGGVKVGTGLTKQGNTISIDSTHLSLFMAGGSEAAPTASQVVLRFVAPTAITLPANLSTSFGKAGTAATASTTFNVQKNGSTIGTVVFASSGTVPTFTTSGGAAQSLAAGDVLTLVAPASPDATLSLVGITIVGTY